MLKELFIYLPYNRKVLFFTFIMGHFLGISFTFDPTFFYIKNANDPTNDIGFINMGACANGASQVIDKTHLKSSLQGKLSSSYGVISILKFENVFKWLKNKLLLVNLCVVPHQNLCSRDGSIPPRPLMGSS